jgi:hypothetical protein
VDLGISKSWASRLHAHAIASLGAALSGRRPRRRTPSVSP